MYSGVKSLQSNDPERLKLRLARTLPALAS